RSASPSRPAGARVPTFWRPRHPLAPAHDCHPDSRKSQPAARQRLLNEDPRLEKRVKLRLKRSPLSEVVAELARQTEVAIRASADVADEPALLFVTDQPAKEVMHHLATLFGYRWTRLGNAAGDRYEIYQDLRSKQEEEALRNRPHALAL